MHCLKHFPKFQVAALDVNNITLSSLLARTHGEAPSMPMQAAASGQRSAGTHEEQPSSSTSGGSSQTDAEGSSSNSGSSSSSSSSSGSASSSGADPRVQDMTERMFKTFRSGYQVLLPASGDGSPRRSSLCHSCAVCGDWLPCRGTGTASRCLVRGYLSQWLPGAARCSTGQGGGAAATAALSAASMQLPCGSAAWCGDAA